jgi:molybdopterin molybdotransferase
MKDMLGRESVIASEEALRRLMEALPKRAPVERTVGIEDALCMVCAADVVSPEDLPSFSRSTVDGYAVAAEDTFGATESMPAYIDLDGEVLMGEAPGFAVRRGSACRMPTGGMLPAGADAVVMFEHVNPVDERLIEVMKPVTPGENVIAHGEDVKRGELLVVRGRRIRPQDIGACAGLGITELKVFGPPVVSIISTGDEVVPAGASPGPGQVRDINSYVISGMLREAGCVPLRKGIFGDEYEAIRSAVQSSLEDSAAIIVSGGTSVGTRDMIARVIDELGDPGILFHGVSLKPGKPMLGGMIGPTPVFGLPGHPAAVAVCFDVFIRPVLAGLSGELQGVRRYTGGTVRARLSRNVASAQGREEHLRVMIEEDESGLVAVPVFGKSGLITTLVKADGTVIIPINVNGIEAGSTVDVRLF